MDGEREKFEAWAGKEADPLAFKISGSGKYVYSGVQAAWEAWQARASLPSAQPIDALTTQQAQSVTEDEIASLVCSVLNDEIESFRIAKRLIAAGVIKGE